MPTTEERANDRDTGAETRDWWAFANQYGRATGIAMPACGVRVSCSPACFPYLKSHLVISCCITPPPTVAVFPSAFTWREFNLRILSWMPRCTPLSVEVHPWAPLTARNGRL